MILNDAGQMIAKQWLALTTRFFNIELHEFIVMPNHFHGVIQINIGATDYVVAPTLSNVGAPLVVAPDAIANDAIAPDNTGQPQHTWQPQGVAPTSKTIGDMMDAFKSITTVEYIRGVKNIGWESFVGKLWQRNYYEHIIRDEQSYLNISNYIINNPATWNDDKFYNS